MVFFGGLNFAILELSARKDENGFKSRFQKNQEQIWRRKLQKKKRVAHYLSERVTSLVLKTIGNRI